MNTLKHFFLLLMMVGYSLPLLSANDSLFVPSIRLGLDVSGLARHLIEPEQIGAGVTADIEWHKNHFVALEAGFTSVDVERESHQYKSDGFFFRLGPDFNVLGRGDHNPNDLVLLSLRYGYGRLEQEAPFILISDPYWGDYEDAIGSESISAHWLEAGLGLKTEVFTHFFMGWALRGRLLLSRSGGTGMDPYIISGFGKHNGSTNLTLHYHLMYRIPLR